MQGKRSAPTLTKDMPLPKLDCAASERVAKTTRRTDADYVTSERDAKRARQADADYLTSEREAKRARRIDTDQKILEPNPPSICVFIIFITRALPGIHQEITSF